MNAWYLEGYFEANGPLRQMALSRLPAVIGRDPACQCHIQSSSVSRQHARLLLVENLLTIEDLGSSNGTYVNRARISHPIALKHGDVIHLGQMEVRLIDRNHKGTDNLPQADDSLDTIVANQTLLSDHFPFGVSELEELLAKRWLNMLFQPIVRADGKTLYGMELLGRGTSPELSPSPGSLFHIAESVGLATDLSELMRDMGVAEAQAFGVRERLFVNTHPDELEQPDRLMKSLSQLRARHPNINLVLEVHEKALADTNLLNEVKRSLDKLEMQLAFDDFGVGQSRLMELVEAKPALIKFDLAMIKDIDKADSDRVSLLRGLKSIADQLNIQCLAECVSTEGEYQVCQTLSFDLYQGYLFGRPGQLGDIISPR